jgi:MoxR-like ATPase
MSVRDIIRVAINTPGPRGNMGLPLLFEGPPGKAKTAIVENVTEECGLHCETIIASIRAPEDFGGIPVPNKDLTGLVRLPDSWVTRVVNAKRAVVFFDEFNHSPSAVLAAMLRVINERVVGDVKLPPGVRFLAAQNAVGDGGGRDLTPAMANRFGHIQWAGTDAEEWASWLLNGSQDLVKGDAEKEEARIEAVWPQHYATAKGIVSAFIRRRPQLLHKMPEVNDPKASKAWPSPRTWELATRAFAGSLLHGLNEIDADTLIASFIGDAAASEWSVWRRENDLPDPSEVLDGKIPFKHNPVRLDRTEALLSACSALLANPQCHDRIKRAIHFWQLVKPICDNSADVCIPAFEVVVRAGLALNNAETKEVAKPVFVRINGVLVSSGHMSK